MNIHLSDQPFTQRQLRVGELLKQLLGNLFLKEEVALPNINTRVITVSEVRMSPDLKHAKVFFMPLGGKNSEFILQSLINNNGLIKRGPPAVPAVWSLAAGQCPGVRRGGAAGPVQ